MEGKELGGPGYVWSRAGPSVKWDHGVPLEHWELVVM